MVNSENSGVLDISKHVFNFDFIDVPRSFQGFGLPQPNTNHKVTQFLLNALNIFVFFLTINVLS